jgi:hypothetical protein
MRTIALLLAMLVSCITPASSQVSLGIRTGYNASNMHITGEAPGSFSVSGGSMEAYHGWHLELFLDVPLTPGLYIQPAFRYITKGTGLKATPDPKAELSGIYIPHGNGLRLNYLEFPLNIVYKYPLGKGRITAGAGSYIAYGLNGRYSYNIMQDGRTISRNSKDVQFTRKNNDNLAVLRMHPWDAGANFSIGYEFFSCLMLGANYSLGLTDIDRQELTSSKNRYVGISLGFLFSREDY